MLEYRKFSISKYCEIQNALLNLPSENQSEKKMKRKDNALTKVEFDVMNILWDIHGGACAWDILERYEDPKPAYTTIATFVKILINKGFLAAEKAGNGTRLFIYRPLLSKDEYTRRVMKDVKDNFFGGSASSFLSFFVREEQMSDDEIQKLFEMIEKGGE